MSAPSPAAASQDLDWLQRRITAAGARRDLLESRRAVLTRDVGLAKGRLNRKPEVDRFLEELQAEAHQKRVGDFERLLTALVAEVLPGEPQIGLDLEIERGQPSLDIVSRRGGDLTEDIYDDQGGALTNVVSTGLRMIAAVRSGTRRFLIMDEADCWVATPRVPTFYRVLKEAATKVGVQCLAISHHDVSTFADGISVARLSGDKDTGAVVENAPRRHKWADDEDGIRWVRLRNFQTFVDETIHLSPGVNALEGRNNLGKSSIVRAFRAVFYGESRDSLIRHGERACTVEIGFSGGRVLHWDRQVRRNPINVWKLLGPDGSVVSERGMVYETGGRTPPDWVPELFGIKEIEGLDVHINTQKSPVFLLNKPGSTRAAVLSIGQESSHIRSMISAHKKRCVEDAACIKNGESEMAGIVEELERLHQLTPLEAKLDEARALHGIVAANRLKHDRLMATLERLMSAEAAAGGARTRLRLFETLPSRADIDDVARRVSDASKLRDIIEKIEGASVTIDKCRRIKEVMSRLPDAPPTITRSDSKIVVGRKIRDAMKHISDLKRKIAVLQRLPAFPELASSEPIEKAMSRILNAREAIAKASAAKDEAAAKVEACKRKMADVLAEMKNACPVCGNRIDDVEDLIGGHPHRPEQ